jgi:hypothetical protein
MPVWRTAVCFVLFAMIACDALQAETPKFDVAVHVNSVSQPVSPEGFVEGSDKWVLDSVADLKKALDGKDFHPNKGYPGSQAHYVVVTDPAKADIVLTVAARGVSLASLGQRTTMEFYRGVVVADTVPTVGVTRWVSIILSVGTYRKEFLTWSTNRSQFSAGAWTADAKLLALLSVSWVMANEAKIRELQLAHATSATAEVPAKAYLTEGRPTPKPESASPPRDIPTPDTRVSTGRPKANAPVYFYRQKSSFDTVLNPTVRCDGIELARLEKGRFFTVLFNEGEHVCSLQGGAASNQELVLSVIRGGAYFVKYGGAASKRLAFVERSVADKDWKQLKPIDPGAVKNPMVITQPLP